ncbi:hypothetical protein [Streptomyces plumbiresistens]|uniref:hypothetical protein n=1 Tax=Streptomyces plumbiresistens TaxID=511811 RepID=UPI003CD06136
MLGDKGYDSNPNLRELRRRRILPVISRKGAPTIKDLGKHRYVVEQAFSPLRHFTRLAVRWATPSSPCPAASPAGDASRRLDHDRVTSS